MSWTLLFNIVAIVYHMTLFYFEGGFSFIVSTRIFWLMICIGFLLFQINVISITNVFLGLSNLNNKILDVTDRNISLAKNFQRFEIKRNQFATEAEDD
jgi:hypothetical protein